MEKDNSIAYLNLGLLALHGGYDKEAISFFKSSIEIRSDIVEAYIGLGLACYRTDDYIGTVEGFRKAILLNPAAVRKWAKTSIRGPHVWLSFSPEHAHMKGKMADFMRKQDEADALARLGAAELSMGRYRSAVDTLEYCLGLAPGYEVATVLLLVAYLLLGSSEKGVTTKTGTNSIFWKVAPKIAGFLFSNT